MINLWLSRKGIRKNVVDFSSVTSLTVSKLLQHIHCIQVSVSNHLSKTEPDSRGAVIQKCSKKVFQ